MWWRYGSIYQIYPRSFADTDGDGVGDLAGVERRLPYLASLGVDAIWLSPVFCSPMRDFGYDIADYRGIDPLFGSMDDFDALLAACHARGLKLLLDFVPNHTSDRHPWFEDSRTSLASEKRDWYIWKDAADDGGPPNNWLSNFGGSAWQWDEPTGQYYYHAFLAAQPDLNWRNPEVRAAMHDVLRFWLDKGVDGFRVDVVWHLIKDEAFRDNPPNPDYRPGQPEIERFLQVHSADQPGVHDVIAEMRAVVDEYADRLLIGEIYLPIERLVHYYGHAGGGVHLPFNFQLLRCPWTAAAIAGLIDEYEAALPHGGWPNWVLSNHDQPRIAARVGERQARVAATLLLTLRGTPTLYYGDELGIGRAAIERGEAQDPWARLEPDTAFNRDEARTPMQWSTEPHAGFSSASPWLPLTDDWPKRNVEMLSTEPGSLLSLYRDLLALRRREPALQSGAYRCLLVEEPVLAYERIGAPAPLAALLNFSRREARVALPPRYAAGTSLFSTEGKRDATPGRECVLRPDEALIVRAASRRDTP